MMQSDDFGARTTVPPWWLPARVTSSVFRQPGRSVRCPQQPRLEGRLAVVTGGNAGIGLEVARGLAQRGAEVVIAARNPATAAAACDAIAKQTGAKVHHVGLDLSDLRSVAEAAEVLLTRLAGRTVDVLVANAGIWPRAHSTSAQGHELAFATNTLGHHLLVRRLQRSGALSERARIVVVTGDIYVLQRACTSDFTYAGRFGGALAYARSKLGNLWFGFELQRRHPALEVAIVHPGVVASGLSGEEPPSFVRNGMMIDIEAGAQAPLWCATQPIERGAYYHNTLGRMRLRPSDPAADATSAAALWSRLEELAAPFG